MRVIITHDARLILQADMRESLPGGVQLEHASRLAFPRPKARGMAKPVVKMYAARARSRDPHPLVPTAALGSRYLPGITFSGGLTPGGLIERMKAMIFQSSSEVLMEKPIGGIGPWTLPHW